MKILIISIIILFLFLIFTSQKKIGEIKKGSERITFLYDTLKFEKTLKSFQSDSIYVFQDSTDNYNLKLFTPIEIQKIDMILEIKEKTKIIEITDTLIIRDNTYKVIAIWQGVIIILQIISSIVR